MDEDRQIDSSYIVDCRMAYVAEIPTYINYILYGIGAFFITFLIWAGFTEIDETTNGEGKVIPSAKVQKIQNLEGGIVSEIHIKEGDKVNKGDKLINLDSTRFGSSYNEHYARFLVLLSNIARLEAQAKMQKTINFPEELSRELELKEHEVNLFNTNVKTLEAELLSLNSGLELAQNELNIVLSLVEDGLMSQLDKLKLEREINEIKRQIQEKRDYFTSGSQAELNEKQAELTSLVENLKGLRDKMVRTVVKAPINGIVHNLQVSTIGGVIKPGDDILDLVPIESNLLIEVRVKPQDIAFIHPGQKATVKVTAYDFTIYGGLKGEVINISPDTVTDSKGVSFYKITIRTEKNTLGTKEKPLPIIPGMTVSGHVLTGKKSVLTYIFKPILRGSKTAFTEK